MTAEEQADKIIEYSRAMPASARGMILEIIAEMNRTEKERDKALSELRKSESAYVELAAIIESVENVFEGKSVSDFMESFPLVRKAMDMARPNKIGD